MFLDKHGGKTRIPETGKEGRKEGRKEGYNGRNKGREVITEGRKEDDGKKEE
jgi:hypothetical protein